MRTFPKNLRMLLFVSLFCMVLGGLLFYCLDSVIHLDTVIADVEEEKGRDLSSHDFYDRYYGQLNRSRPAVPAANALKIGVAGLGLMGVADDFIWTEHQAGIKGLSFLPLAMSSDGSRIVVGEEEGSLHLSTDYGATWTRLTDGPWGQWRGIAASSDGTKFVAVALDRIIYTSADGGVTWTGQPGSDYGGFKDYWTAVTSSADGTHLAAVDMAGYVYTSDDSGVTWTERTGSGTNGWISIASSADGSKLVLLGWRCISTSTNYGETWTLQYASYQDWTSAASSADGANLVAVAGGSWRFPDYAGTDYVYTSSNSGVTWISQAAAGVRPWIAVASSSDGTKLAAVATDNNVYTSADSGVHWTERVASGATRWDSIASSTDGTYLVATAFGATIAVSSDSGATWSLSEFTEPGGYWVSIAASADATKLIAADSDDSRWVGSDFLYTSPDFGDTWVEQNLTGSLPWMGVASSADGTRLAATTYEYYDFVDGGGSIFTSQNSGIHWTERLSSDTAWWISIASSTDGMNLVVADKTGTDGNGGYIYTSADGGATWTPQTDAGLRHWSSVASSSDGTKFVAVEDGADYYGGYILTSVDSGAHWTEQQDAGLATWGSVASSADGTKLVVTTWDSGSYRSVDSGAHWTLLTGQQGSWGDIVSSADGSRLAVISYAGDDGCLAWIYTSSDAGATWFEQSGAGARCWTAITSSADGTRLAATVWGGYIYTAELDSTAPVIDLACAFPDPQSDPIPEFTGTASDDYGTILSVEYQVDSTSGAWLPCTAADGGFNEMVESFSCAVSPALADGTHTIFVRSTDDSQNVTAGDDIPSCVYTVESPSPVVQLTCVSGPVSDTTPTCTGTAVNDYFPIVAVEYQIGSTSGNWSPCTSDDGVFDENQETYSCTIMPPLTNGVHSVYVRAVDGSGKSTPVEDMASCVYTIVILVETGVGVGLPLGLGCALLLVLGNFGRKGYERKS